jgi:8-amino-3,8-dideoxy-alpha-D-manno-octulosonate transaminase
MKYGSVDLALNGGPKARTRESPPMYPGGLEIGEEEKREVMEVLDSRYLFRYYGPADVPSKVKRLEEEYSRYVGVKHSLAVNSCTSALITALIAVGVEPGDEVIVPAYTFFASCAAVVAAKAVPVICEVDKTLTMDPADLERKITKRTKAILPVHMRGMPARMDRIMEIATRHKLKVVEDVAQSNGGSFKGRKLGSIGDAGAFSLQYHKIITAGEGGVITTNGDLIYTRSQAYHDIAACWRKDRFAPPEFEGEIFFGVNFRMSELHGAVALAQFRKLDGIVARMRHNQSRIISQIRDVPYVELRETTDGAGDTAVCVVFYLPDASQVRGFCEALRAEGIGAAGVYDKGIPDWHMYQHWTILHKKMMPTKKGCPFNCALTDPAPEYRPDACPQTAAILARSVHIDIPPQLEDKDCDEIALGIRKVGQVLLQKR